MEQILEYITQYSLAVFVIASCNIAFIGILKLCKVFSKIINKNIRKLIYYVINIVLAFIGTAIYFALFRLNYNNYIVHSFTQIGATTTLYAIYENFSIRKLVQICLTWIATWFKSNPENKFVKALKSMGLTEEAINTELEKIKTQIASEQNTEIKN